MSNTKRTTLAKKESRSKTQELQDALEEGFKVTLDGKRWYELRVGDVTSTQVRQLRNAAGMSFGQLMQLMGSEALDSDVIATFIWLCQLVDGDDKVALDDVVVTYRQMLSDDFDLQGTEDPAGAAKKVGLDPEA